MKKLIFFFCIGLSGLNLALAQDCYTIKMTMKIEGLPPEYAGFGEQEMVNYLKGELYRNESSSMMGSSTTCFDGKVLTSVSDQMGNKTGYTATKEELDDASQKESQEKPKIEYSGETKKLQVTTAQRQP